MSLPGRRLAGLTVFFFFSFAAWLSPIFLDHSFDGELMGTTHSANLATCLSPRKPSPFPPQPHRTYHHFDDVLLIVFFSHARYDVNLDHYREVYADYFPNVRCF